MFNIGWAEFVVLVVAGLFILGPERLPAAAAWLGRTVRQVREYATGAREQLRAELGPEFDQLRQPLEELRGIRGFTPRTVITRQLLDSLNDPVPGRLDNAVPGNGQHHLPPDPLPGTSRPLQPGERPPFDPDAT